MAAALATASGGLVTASTALTAASDAAAPAATPTASLERFGCRRSHAALNRAISVTAVMHAKPGLPRLELEFELQRKTRRSHRFKGLREGDLGKWISPSDSSLGQRANDVWMLDKQVVNLAAPAAYRFEVHFRWSTAKRNVQSTLFSSKCLETR